MKPAIRWVGAKRRLASRLAREIEAVCPKLYIEPFLGGGAVALAISSTIPKILSDANLTLIDAWRCLQKHPAVVMSDLGRVEQEFGNDQDGYLRARALMNTLINLNRPLSIRRAALFLYLNARCFNGLWRTNQNGLFNVPFGKLEKPSSIDLAEATALSTFLSNTKLFDTSYREILDLYSGSLYSSAIYCDPPYHKTFSQYTKGDFTEDDQRELAEHLERSAKLGAKIWATNADTPLIREIYSWAKLESVEETHVVGATGARRGKQSCLLIRG